MMRTTFFVAAWLTWGAFPAAAQSAVPWFESCGSLVEVTTVAGKVKSEGAPWDGPVSFNGLSARQAPDISVCSDRCSTDCEDSYNCTSIVYDPDQELTIYDWDLLRHDLIGTCRRGVGAWTCRDVPGSRVSVRTLKPSSCTVEFDRRLRRSEQDGCQVQAVIWTRATLLRDANQLMRRQVGRLLARHYAAMGPTLRKLVGSVERETRSPDFAPDVEALALDLARLTEWLPADHLRFALLLSAVRDDPDAARGLYPLVDTEVSRACEALVS